MTQRGQKISHCHEYVAKIAKELCAASYDELMSQNVLYDAWKKANPGLCRGPSVDSVKLKRKFVTAKWGMYIAAARTTLGLLLREPTLTESDKEKIVEVLALDQTLIRGRVNPATLAGAITQKH